MTIIVSTTAVAHGFGRDPFKWVSGLTREERQAVKEGSALVIFDSEHREGGNSGSTFRKVTRVKVRGLLRTTYRWGRRCLSQQEKELCLLAGIEV